MSISFTCSCGESLTVEQSQQGRQAYCPSCKKSVDIPNSSKSQMSEDSPTPREDLEPVTAKAKSATKAAGTSEPETNQAGKKKEQESDYEGEIFEPPHLDRIKDKNGQDCWKLTCYCDKRILSPLKVENPVGRCPKCGRRLRLPGFRPGSSRQTRQSNRTKVCLLYTSDAADEN